jgi:alginate O-acetyltransferase complex protein AlgI
MPFNSFSFLGFFSLVIVAYYVCPPRHRVALLLLSSWASYATFRPVYLFLLGGLTAIGYLGGVLIERSTTTSSRRRWTTVAVVTALSPLVVNKYFDFAIGTVDSLLSMTGSTWTPPRLDLVAAAGLSFYTFSCLSYLFDVSRRASPAERHVGRFALYLAFFPKLLAGPIERAGSFTSHLHTAVRFEPETVVAGLQLMLWGLFKKVVVADRLAPIVDAAYRLPTLSAPVDLLIATYFFAFQIYCDFSGYSDIAIGAAQVLGVPLGENFRRPYLATSVKEFWASRWHLSLSSWFRDYLYLPLGGRRRGLSRMYFNLLIVFLVSGLWHGARWTFVIWGGLNGLFQIVEDGVTRWRGGPRPTVPRTALRVFGQRLLTFHLVLVTWVFFRVSSIEDGMTIIARIATSMSSTGRLLWPRLGRPDTLVALGLIVVLLVVEWLDESRSIWARLNAQPKVVRWAAYYALLCSLVVLGRWNLTQFVYLQF